MLAQTTYLILAGGRGQRMQGTDKGLMLWRGQPMIEHIIAALGITGDQLIISANRHLQAYQRYSERVVTDTLDNYQGPLVGILSAMQICQTSNIICVPCDSPRPPAKLLETLWQCREQAGCNAAVCHDGERIQPLFNLLSIECKVQLEQYLASGQRKVESFMLSLEPAICDFSRQQPAFRNFNRPEDMHDD